MPAIEDIDQGGSCLLSVLVLVRALAALLGLAFHIPSNTSVLPPGLPPQVIKETFGNDSANVQ